MAVPVSIRRPEYTGHQRCWPCTLLNLGLLAVGVILLATRRPAMAAGAGVLGVGAIWARGYIVPYTPRFAPHLARWLPGDLFGHDDAPDTLGSLAEDTEDPGEQLLEGLLEGGVLEVHGEALALDPSFRDRWVARADELAALDLDALAEATLVASNAAEEAEGVERGDQAFVVLSAQDGGAAWVHRPAAIAETAAAQTLAAWGHPPAGRDLAAHALCAFLETCPACGDDVVEQTAAECCGGIAPSPTLEAPPVLACPRCEVQFFRLDEA